MTSLCYANYITVLCAFEDLYCNCSSKLAAIDRNVCLSDPYDNTTPVRAILQILPTEDDFQDFIERHEETLHNNVFIQTLDPSEYMRWSKYTEDSSYAAMRRVIYSKYYTILENVVDMIYRIGAKRESRNHTIYIGSDDDNDSIFYDHRWVYDDSISSDNGLDDDDDDLL